MSLLKQNNGKLIVGTNRLGYPEIRNFAGLDLERFSVEKTFDYCQLLDHLHFRLFRRNSLFFHNLHADLGLNRRVSLYHFFNTISLTSKPWVVTYESHLPRFNPKSHWGVKLLTNKSCKQILAFSQTAYQKQEFNLSSFDEKDLILSKTTVLHPSQRLNIEDIEEKQLPETINFTFAGNDFFRKGGKETVLCMTRLIDEGHDITLNLVTKFHYGQWKDDFIKDDDVVTMKKLISNYPDRIKYHDGLPNAEIINLLKRTHIAILPSYGETYGYYVLEAQSCGCPVLTTKMQPFTEFNHEGIGWLIDVPLSMLRGLLTSYVYTKEKREEFSGVLLENMYDTIKKILSDPSQIKGKGARALENIRNNFNPSDRVAQLERIYHGALE